MSHLGRPGPWAIFRDLIGASSWERLSQPGKFEKFIGIACTGYIPATLNFLRPISDEIIYTPGGTTFTYMWRTHDGVGLGSGAVITVTYSFPDGGKYMSADIVVDHPDCHAEGAMRWHDYEGYRRIRTTLLPGAVMLPGYTSTDHTYWHWPTTGLPDSTGLTSRMANWYEL